MLHNLRLPLYEGVDWNIFYCPYGLGCRCLPLYEGVDWNQWGHSKKAFCHCVSLFTREWIEIYSIIVDRTMYAASPSLRGSGLKWPCTLFFACPVWRLPLYEGVDWNQHIGRLAKNRRCLPLYEGVDWNIVTYHSMMPTIVSLFTREWIEIFWWGCLNAGVVSPSLRGSGLKSFYRPVTDTSGNRSPSLRGSGLKCKWAASITTTRQSPSLRGSGLKYLP